MHPTPARAYGADVPTIRKARRTAARIQYAVATAACGLVAAAFAPAAALAGDGTFPTEVGGSPFSSGALARAIAVGDFDNDGNQDLAVPHLENFTVDVRLGSGTADTFATPTESCRLGGDLAAVAVGDFDNDGNEDLAMAIEEPTADFVGVCLGSGSASDPFPPDGVSTYGTHGAGRSVAVGDFNNDGNEDLAVANVGGTVTVRLGNGSASNTFANEAVGSPFSFGVGQGGWSVAVGDFNNDGNEDLTVAKAGTDTVGVRFGNGTGSNTFASRPTDALIPVGDSPRAVAVGDFNNDGNEDLAVANTQDDNVTVLLGNGALTGTFATAAAGSPFPAGDLPHSIAVGDFNSDGNEDLAVANFGTSDVTVRLGSGTASGTFATEADGSPFATGLGPVAVTIGDFDEDGNEDLATANLGRPELGDYAGTITVRLGAGTPPLAGNLLQNGGFEGAGAARLFTQSPSIPGWQRTGGMTYARYGIVSPAFFPGHLDSARFMSGGGNFLWGGGLRVVDGATSDGMADMAFQAVDVSAAAASIDAGVARADLSAYLGGGNVSQDRMLATAAFLGASGAELGSFAIGPVTTADRRSRTTLLRRAASAPVTTGTRQIRVTLTAIESEPDDPTAAVSSAYADNVKLTLDAPNPPPPTTSPEPPPEAIGPDVVDPSQVDPADTIAPETAGGHGPRKRTTGRRATFRFSSEPGAKFECRLDRRPFEPCSSPQRVRRLKLGKHAFEARASDAAGNVDPTPALWRWRVVG